MTPKEMHIAVEQGLQKHTSYVFDDFLPEEIDLVLNKVQKRFIDDKFRRDNVSEGFEIEQGDLDDLQFLIEKDIELPAFVNLASKKAYSVFPSDYLYLVNDRTLINDDCKVLDLTPLTPYTEEYVYTYPFDNSTASENYYAGFNIIYGGTTIFDLANYTISAGLTSNEERFVIKNLVLDVIRHSLPSDIIGIYWERYRNQYAPNSFIIVSKSNVSNNSITVDGVGTPVLVIGSATPNLSVSTITPNKEVNNRLTKSENLYEVAKDNAFYRTIPRSPISNISKDLIYVHFNERFIVTSLIIDYIRIPQNINLHLDRSCELDENTHERIVDLAVEYIKNTIEQPSYDIKVRDNILRGE
jgi:hypothetical protein